MKNSILYVICAVLISAACSSCSTQDDIYKQYVKPGGYDYPAKALNLEYERGYQRVIISWEKPMDPAVKTARLFWDNYTDSLNVDYADYPDGKVTLEIAKLEDRSYTFDVKDYDGNGNVSLPEEITVSPYGDSWMVSRTERTVVSAEMNGTDGEIEMSKMTDEMIATRFRYKNLSDEWVEFGTLMTGDRVKFTFPDALKGKKFEYSSCYCPVGGLDTVWRAWVKSSDGFSYQLNGKRWDVSATRGQVFGENTPDKIFDGKILPGCRWHSSRDEATRGGFPKILAIDTRDQYSFTKFTFWENTDSKSMRYIKNFFIYVGSSPFDPDVETYSTTYGIPFISGSLSVNSAEQTVKATKGAAGRYLAIVFPDSWNKEEGYVDLWELIPYGYNSEEAD